MRASDTTGPCQGSARVPSTISHRVPACHRSASRAARSFAAQAEVYDEDVQCLIPALGAAHGRRSLGLRAIQFARAAVLDAVLRPGAPQARWLRCPRPTPHRSGVIGLSAGKASHLCPTRRERARM